jgi:hypothetical protein
MNMVALPHMAMGANDDAAQTLYTQQAATEQSSNVHAHVFRCRYNKTPTATVSANLRQLYNNSASTQSSNQCGVC